jgi:ankyrin repeat protein
MRMAAGWPRLIPIALTVLLMGAGGGPPSLVDAAKHADKEALRGLLKQGANVNAPDGDGTTALHWASYRDDLESADLLIRAGAKVNATNDLGATPLWTASQNGSEAMVKRLLAAGANPNMGLLVGETPLMVAARSGSGAVVEQLLAKGANPNAHGARGQTALMWAVSQLHADVVKVLLAHGADIQARSNRESIVSAVTPHGYLPYNRDIPFGSETALLFAARVGDVASAKLLVAAGAKVNDADAWGVSAVTLAAHSGFEEMVEFLLEKGADPNVAGPGFTGLHEAVMRRNERIVAALLDHGADANMPLKTWTPLRRSSHDWNFDPELVGATPFWLAARYSEPGIMRLLLKHGADPLFVHHEEYVTSARGNDPSAYDTRKESITALMAATGLGGGTPWIEPEAGKIQALTLEAVQMLVELGIDVNAANTDGGTALDAANALRPKNDAVVKVLLAKGAKPGVRKGPAGGRGRVRDIV